MNEVVKWASMAGMLVNKPKRGKKCGKWAKEALSKRLMEECADTAGTSAHKPMG